MPRYPATIREASDRRLTRILALQLPRDRAAETTPTGGVRLGAIRVTDSSGWLVVTTFDLSVRATLRTIDVHLVLEQSTGPGSQTNVWIDAIRLCGIQWRSVREFLDATDHSWGPILARETERAIRCATHSGEHRRLPNDE